MIPDFHPLSIWLPAALCVGFIGFAFFFAYLYLSLKVELRLLAKHTPRRQELDARIRPLEAELEQLRTKLADSERSRSAPAGWTAEPVSVNLNRRGQILRLFRKGKTTAEIASDLQISQGEVELMVKIHVLHKAWGVWRLRRLFSSFAQDGPI